MYILIQLVACSRLFCDSNYLKLKIADYSHILQKKNIKKSPKRGCEVKQMQILYRKMTAFAHKNKSKCFEKDICIDVVLYLYMPTINTILNHLFIIVYYLFGKEMVKQKYNLKIMLNTGL